MPGLKNGKFHWYHVAIFGEYPVFFYIFKKKFKYLIAIILSWGFCWILTLFNLVPPESEARTDKNLTIKAISDSAWFQIPYLGINFLVF